MLKAEYQERGPVPQDVIQAVQFEEPELQEGQVLLEMLASPINPSDVLTLTGEYGMLPPLPAIGGNEGIAKVIKHGPNVSGPDIGQTVLLPVGSGTWATHMVADAKGLIPLPNDVDPVQLSMITINPPTAYLLLNDFVDLQEGDWVIQNAANSGVGSYLTSLAKLRGLKIVNVVRRASLVEPLLAAGADVVLVDGEVGGKNLAQRVEAATDGAQIRLGIDAVGGMATARLGETLCDGATLVNYGALSREPCLLAPSVIIFKDITVRGFWLAKWFGTATLERQQEVLGAITGLVAEGKLSAPVHATYPLKDIKEAVRVAAAGERNGKVLMVGEALLK
ncbi:zinc-dependent alcohol dehydrogenase family protein [Microbulbifer epialgicus]|uniref:enoyl-[acyl-carrier-protein] reductase n=2 Tax=Microbulbifer epialgicus TaxID=393907 RepID=A0ABV4P3I0_9GAMM